MAHTSFRSGSRRLVLAAAFLTTSVLVGCGGSDEPSASECQVVEPTSPGKTELSVTAKDNQFVERCFQVQPGTVTVNFTNEDTISAHNFHLSGNGVDESTKLQKGPFEERLVMQLDTPGTYGYVCDPHPYMTGKVIVAGPGASAAG